VNELRLCDRDADLACVRQTSVANSEGPPCFNCQNAYAADTHSGHTKRFSPRLDYQGTKAVKGHSAGVLVLCLRVVSSSWWPALHYFLRLTYVSVSLAEENDRGQHRHAKLDSEVSRGSDMLNGRATVWSGDAQ
jgi:hypothetical protein